jgi:hypothetical protein
MHGRRFLPTDDVVLCASAHECVLVFAAEISEGSSRSMSGINVLSGPHVLVDSLYVSFSLSGYWRKTCHIAS